VLSWWKRLRWMARISYLVGAVALGTVATMSYHFGASVGETATGRGIFSAVFLILSAAGSVVFSFIAGRQLREGHYFSAIAPALILLMAMIWNMIAVLGFIATERLWAAAGQRAALEAEQKRADHQALKGREVVKGSATVRGGINSRDERREFITAASAEVNKPVTQTVSTMLLPAAHAEMLGKVLSSLPVIGREVSTEQVNIIITVYTTFLLIFIQNAGFAYGSYYEQRKPGGKRGGGKHQTGARKPFWRRWKLFAEYALRHGPQGNGFPNSQKPFPNATAEAPERNPPPLRPIGRAEALSDLMNILNDGGLSPSQEFLVERWGVAKGTVSKWLTQWEAEHDVCRRRDDRDGRRNILQWRRTRSTERGGG
jgi:hypothetical protein